MKGDCIMPIRYHYCSIETFEQIIKNRTLRLSNIRNSNDLTEMEWFTKQYEGMSNIFKQFWAPEYENSWENLEKHMETITKNTACFATCFSIGADKLSQWERYGDKCKGVAIGFEEKDLNSYVQDLCSVIEYECIDKEKFSFVKLIAKKINYKKKIYVGHPHDLCAQYRDPLNYLINCAFTKDSGFSEEREFRIALILGNCAETSHIIDENLKRVNDGYFDLKFDLSFIKEIYLGPLCEKTEEYIRKQHTSCEIKKSYTPYSPKRFNYQK